MRIPEIIAHRGTPRECRENTLPGFERALAQGADGIELDVHMTSDNVVVVHHDAATCIPMRVRARRPGIPIGLLSASYPLDLSAALHGTTAYALWQQSGLIDAALIPEAHALGLRVIAWTENDVAHARYLSRIGVDALCTDISGQMPRDLER